MRDVSTCKPPTRGHPRNDRSKYCDNSPNHEKFPMTWRVIAGKQKEAPRRTIPRPSSIEEPQFDQQSTTDWARPASLVSLYLLFMSLAVWARAVTVSSKLTRCLDAISLLAIW